jgi:hypothetical protein
VVVEGLYGVRLRRDALSISPRLGWRAGDISAQLPGTGLYAKYTYRPSLDALRLTYDTNYEIPDFPLELALPVGFAPMGVYLDGDGTVGGWKVWRHGGDYYLSLRLPPGEHALEIGGESARRD